MGVFRGSKRLFRSPERPTFGTVAVPKISALPYGEDFLFFVSDGPLSFNSERKGGKNASKNYVFAFPQRAVPF